MKTERLVKQRIRTLHSRFCRKLGTGYTAENKPLRISLAAQIETLEWVLEQKTVREVEEMLSAHLTVENDLFPKRRQ